MNQLVTYAMSDMERVARALAGSGLFGVKNVEQALALCLVAQAEGRHPATAAQDYSIIQGRPAKKADAMLRDFLASGGKVEWHALDDTKADATFSHPAGGSARIDWTMARAKAAGLAGNAMYTKYPRQMLRSRTVSEGVRTVCPGATSGMYVPEEVQDIVAEQPAVTSVEDIAESAPPKRKSSAQAKRDGDDVRIKDDINACDLDGLKEWHVHFDEWTADLPLSWLDSIRNMMELRMEELNAVTGDDDLDAEFRSIIGDGERGAAALAHGDREVA